MILRLNKKQLAELIEAQEAAGTDATELKSLLAEVEQDEEHIVIGLRSNDDYVAEKRAQIEIEHGTDLECMICHQKFGQLFSGTCEACFRKWVLSTKKRG